jgi:hypothetical protein
MWRARRDSNLSRLAGVSETNSVAPLLGRMVTFPNGDPLTGDASIIHESAGYAIFLYFARQECPHPMTILLA